MLSHLGHACFFSRTIFVHVSLEWFWFCTSHLCFVFTWFLSLPCARLAEWPVHSCYACHLWNHLCQWSHVVLPWILYFLSVFVFKPPLLPCMCDLIRFGPIRYHIRQAAHWAAVTQARWQFLASYEVFNIPKIYIIFEWDGNEMGNGISPCFFAFSRGGVWQTIPKSLFSFLDELLAFL